MDLLLENKGERTTTVHKIGILFTYNNNPYHLHDSRELILKSGESKNESFNFTIHKNQIQIGDTLTNVKLIIQHTHGKKNEIIKIIKKCQ